MIFLLNQYIEIPRKDYDWPHLSHISSFWTNHCGQEDWPDLGDNVHLCGWGKVAVL